MKRITYLDIMDQRKSVSHLAFIIFSVVVSAFLGNSGKYTGAPYSVAGIFLLLFLQLEAFIFLGHLLFSKVNFDRSPREITLVVLSRLIIFLAACMLVAVAFYLIVQYFFTCLQGGDLSKVLPDFIHNGFHQMVRSTSTGLIVGALIFIILQWQASLRREQRLREENLIFQNETLKSQVNPHFLFNCLNTLSSLVGSQPVVAEEFIRRFSSIYRYILENGSKDRVPLDVELAFIQDYFFLHLIRDDGKIMLEMKSENSGSYQILPVSLQILVENAIKHNKATRESPLVIQIYTEDETIVVRNNLQRMAVQLASTQIGLKNLSERIRLSTGKSLIIEESKEYFTVKIPLKK